MEKICYADEDTMHTKKTQTAASASRAAFPLTLPVMEGYIFLGMTY